MKNKQGLKQGCGAGAGLFCWSRSQPFLLEPEPAFLLEPEQAFFSGAGAASNATAPQPCFKGTIAQDLFVF